MSLLSYKNVREEWLENDAPVILDLILYTTIQEFN
jgi:hypothetical protein